MHTGSHSSSPVQIKRARIEIIPLIDIMFFLLASFMLVSLTMINVKAVKVDLPNANSAVQNNNPDFTVISIDADGQVYLDEKKVTPDELSDKLGKLYVRSHESRIFVSCDKKAKYGAAVTVLAAVRLAGFQKVGFEMKPESK
jgi:biopolymer transport protein ExbD